LLFWGHQQLRAILDTLNFVFVSRTRVQRPPRQSPAQDGATAAATGAITGAVIVLGVRAITDIPTAIIALISLAVLWRYKIGEPIVVTISGLVGLVLWPLIKAG